MTSTGPPTRAVQIDRLEIRRRRVRTIRRRTVAGSLAAFAAAWGIIFSQLVTGHDPALGNNKQASSAPAAVSSSSTSSGSSSTSPPDDYEPDYSTDDGYSSAPSDPAGSTASSSSATPAPLAPMTTQQS